jgi:hypothetical protein
LKRNITSSSSYCQLRRNFNSNWVRNYKCNQIIRYFEVVWCFCLNLKWKRIIFIFQKFFCPNFPELCFLSSKKIEAIRLEPKKVKNWIWGICLYYKIIGGWNCCERIVRWNLEQIWVSSAHNGNDLILVYLNIFCICCEIFRH